jgi:hypothetical protein|tara:strand:- start:15 stop:137 length:123 start_codon:yes stop_codon:yes gene_type:complete
MNFLVKNVAVEQYIELQKSSSPMDAMEALGFKPRKKRQAA